MAIVKKCDRCGKHYDENITFKTCEPFFNYILTGIATVDQSHESDKIYDLCDDCIADLFEFLNNER